ncbi:hypothetical protein Tcan_17775 [Toxocara canis]|uniref:Uncharacterized protein n=1 Tax=Toxocara canis TaxID=6265 RepID=A0A0B2USA5_TOXCA|nr:hypothetical protein Tcan_17775 [Toxocara canis]
MTSVNYMLLSVLFNSEDGIGLEREIKPNFRASGTSDMHENPSYDASSPFRWSKLGRKMMNTCAEEIAGIDRWMYVDTVDNA